MNTTERMRNVSDIIPKIPRETSPEDIFSKILQSPEACARLQDTFYQHLDENGRVTISQPENFAKILFSAYENQDISALLLALCQRSMFDLLRDAYLVPKRFHGKAGENPVLLTDADGNLLEKAKKSVSHHEFAKFQEVFHSHSRAPRSRLYLADGYDIVRSFTTDLEIRETLYNAKRGILVLYALPDTAVQGLSEADAYAVVWDAFCAVQEAAPTAIMFYGQDTGVQREKPFDEVGVLLPIHRFEKKILHYLEEIDGIILSCREKMMEKAGKNSLDL